MTTEINNINEYKSYLDKVVFTSKGGFITETSKLVSLMLPLEDRIQAVEALTEAYFAHRGEMPTKIKMQDRRGRFVEALDLLADHLMYEFLEGDARPDKITLEERPVLTPNQIKRRVQDRGEISVDFNAALKSQASDGKNYRRPNRRVRSPYENHKVEEQALEKAKENNEAYRDAINPSKIRRLKVV
ncbi:hypothetical protein [Bacillus mycoides]|uniref:Uncharacterized protein n=1 Tax=Bacillus mycoides (strain KBAB4) TaxID=315730 RepID=A9VVG7_BACMK|nr:hypothetical protein [Bacillus mycoides]ABY46782.1 conserved hypothetical protein [Bacillus mycoides KBAB4]